MIVPDRLRGIQKRHNNLISPYSAISGLVFYRHPVITPRYAMTVTPEFAGSSPRSGVQVSKKQHPPPTRKDSVLCVTERATQNMIDKTYHFIDIYQYIPLLIVCRINVIRRTQKCQRIV